MLTEFWDHCFEMRMVEISGDNKQTVGFSAGPDMGRVLDQTPVQCCGAPELEDRVRELERLLCKANRECKQRRQFNNILQAENNQMKKIFQQKEMFLKESLSDAQLKHQKALESISQLEEEKSELTKLVNTLFSRGQELGEELCHLSHLEIDELQIEYEQKQEAHSAQMLENELMKKNLIHEVLKVSLADAELKHQKALESIRQLEEEKSELTKRVNTLRSTVQELGEELCHSHLQSDELQIEFEQKQEAHSALLLEYEEMKKELMHKEEVLKLPLADDELKHQKALESISQLEEEKSELTNLVKKLRFVVQELGEELCNCHLQFDELQIEYEQKQEAHSALLLENEEMKKELKHKEEVLKVSLADAELKHQKALESISQLEDEKSELTNLVNTLRSTVQELGEELCHSHRQSDELQIECERQQLAHTDLLLECKQTK
ncbi:hypothetical protein KOW79_003494 [Hemibagrus wyckioides]|uniref:Uncharacterized protein n=2 Tax=Hemibagrus wyckioides TaxID=337641 RepID=A0A9D3P4C2_9TELE|nr:hypothetical protein KOW79_003494 [Hemibagrus wyckioides]